MPSRSEIEKEVQEDLTKSDKQLLVDIHEEILCDGRSLPENLIHAQKRLASLFINLSRRAEKSTEKIINLTKQLRHLTWVIVFLSVALIVIGFIQVILQLNYKSVEITENSAKTIKRNRTSNNNSQIPKINKPAKPSKAIPMSKAPEEGIKQGVKHK